MSKIKRICSVTTIYTLFLYFLLISYDENDIFVFSGGIPKYVRNNIKHIYFPHLTFNFDGDSSLILFLIKNKQKSVMNYDINL